jgi:hypothetical protein
VGGLGVGDPVEDRKPLLRHPHRKPHETARLEDGKIVTGQGREGAQALGELGVHPA